MSHVSINKLKDRAQMFAACRAFFDKRGVMEVDVPLLSKTAPIDLHIDLIEVTALGKKAFLHSSPEYGMKRLLAEGSGDIFQLGHVFRDLESGSRHSVEFTMAEWYRLGFTLNMLIDEVFSFLQLFIKLQGYEVLSHAEVWKGHDDESFAFEVEPNLGRGGKATFIIDYPPEEAALAQVNEEGFAERFELFVEGVELANGYHELACSAEQKRRLVEENREREALGKMVYPLDEAFIEAVGQLPDCSGVAVGFDRLMMLRHDVDDIRRILPHDTLVQTAAFP